MTGVLEEKITVANTADGNVDDCIVFIIYVIWIVCILATQPCLHR